MTTIAIGSDHVGVRLRGEIKTYLLDQGYQVEDLGPETETRTDYPIYAKKVAHAVTEGRADLGILICGTGIGISIAANKVNGIRAVACSEPYSAKLSRQHNNTNILAFGARVVGLDLAKMIVDEWLNASYLGGRHARRVDEIGALEQSDDNLFEHIRTANDVRYVDKEEL
ncbi:ribose 5-phosphate isomerase B [Lacticaseibacillus songhuajiangensis]|jgi:ribose 5-phosphate isomerase B|uniref:ribose 5-phosphate isomerase B n=1 Tax=Lacticaseibacillus songhuajiangensis TaxID=1296539 RepID=UPI000F7A2BA3|nr:ribose 5-phosphate isomerase B [Lacticaseibacillus songhuajiangensis]